jgi:1-acyl-sn-glycerol-3-phosphate acyltransferase
MTRISGLGFARRFGYNWKSDMASYESEFYRIHKMIMRLSNFGLFPKSIEVKGAENFVREGANIIVGNHIGSFKDVGLLFKIVPRPIFFTANKMIFNRDDFSFLVRKHLHRHLKEFGLFIHLLLAPYYRLAVDYISSHIAAVGSIPVDLDGGRAEAIRKCVDYLKVGRAVIALQGRGRVDPRDANPYIKKFRRGAAVMAYTLFEETGISVPVTPLAIFGTHVPFPVPGTVKVSVGAPLFIADHLAADSNATIEHFRAALQARVTSQFLDLIKS